MASHCNWPVCFLYDNGAACDTDNNKLHNEKTSQLTKGQRYDKSAKLILSYSVTTILGVQASTLTYFSTCPFGQVTITIKKYLSDSIF
jgi:hypothetical protein